MGKRLLFFLCYAAIFTSVKAKNIYSQNTAIKRTHAASFIIKQPAGLLTDSLKTNAADTIYPKKHRLVAALLAFPLGIFGLHRMYLGTKGAVPLVYIATAGGAFGVLPFIDFVLILLSKNIHKTYTNNNHLFMWQKR